MRIAVLTANLGKFDNIFGMPKQQGIKFDFFYYNEHNLPFPLPNLNNRLKSKYLKIQTHRFLPDYDAYIWIDSSIEILANIFVVNFLSYLEADQLSVDSYDVAIYKHCERNNVYEEINYILDSISIGNKYLTSRYGDQLIHRELMLYKNNKLPDEYPLFNTYMFARLNNVKVNNAFDEWWRRCIEFSNFDQAMFSLIAYQHKLNIKQLVIDPIRTTKLFKRQQHL